MHVGAQFIAPLHHGPDFDFDVSGKSFGLYQQWLHLVLIALTRPSEGSCTISSKESSVAAASVIGCA